MSRRNSRDDISNFHDYGIHLTKKVMYIGSEHDFPDTGESGTDSGMAARAIKNLYILDSLPNEETLTIILNNIGGDVNHGLAIYDAIKQCKSHVTVKVLGSAMSMGSIILQAADERIMAPSAVQMIHYGYLALEGHAKTSYKATEENKRVDKWMENLYLARIRQKLPKYSLFKLRSLLDHDTYLTAEESVNLGLADKVE